jgi:hypothetical protein
VLGDPAGNTFAHSHSQISEFGAVRNLRCPEDNLATFRFEEIDQASITISDLCGQPNNLSEHFIKRELGADDTADSVKKCNL